MRKFSAGQLKALSEMSGNVAVAWFAAGFIGPLFTDTIKDEKRVFILVISVLMTTGFGFFSLEVVRNVKS